MFKRIKDVKINYKQYGTGDPVVLLHGWGQNIAMMEPIGNKLKENHKIIIVDLPGFGLSEEPKESFSVSDYTLVIHELLQELEIDNPTIIGHSFGGRIAIIYASMYPVNKLVLFGSPCVRHEYKSIKQTIFKNMKKVKILNPLVKYMKNHTGSVDYKKASERMKEILVKTVNEDLSSYAKKITCPTLLIWGDNDTAVPVSMANEIKELVSDSALIVLPGTHYCYLENIDQVGNILNKFL